MSLINDAQTNHVCALSITLTSYFRLNTASVYNGCSRVLEKFVRISGVMCIRAPDAPNSLFLQRNYLLIVNSE